MENVKCLLSVNTFVVVVPKRGGRARGKGEELLLHCSVVPGVSGAIPTKNLSCRKILLVLWREEVLSIFQLFLTVLTQGSGIWAYLETQLGYIGEEQGTWSPYIPQVYLLFATLHVESSNRCFKLLFFPSLSYIGDKRNLKKTKQNLTVEFFSSPKSHK